jgi:hypothetical protein
MAKAIENYHTTQTYRSVSDTNIEICLVGEPNFRGGEINENS